MVHDVLFAQIHAYGYVGQGTQVPVHNSTLTFGGTTIYSYNTLLRSQVHEQL